MVLNKRLGETQRAGWNTREGWRVEHEGSVEGQAEEGAAYIPVERLAGVFGGAGEGVREVIGGARLIPVHAHGPVALVVADAGVERAVDGDLLVVGTQAVPVRVRVREQATLRASRKQAERKNT